MADLLKRNYRNIGLRIHTPATVAKAHSAVHFAELYDMESGDPLNLKFSALKIIASPDGAIEVEARLFPNEIVAVPDYPRCVHGRGQTEYCEPCGRIHSD